VTFFIKPVTKYNSCQHDCDHMGHSSSSQQTSTIIYTWDGCGLHHAQQINRLITPYHVELERRPTRWNSCIQTYAILLTQPNISQTNINVDKYSLYLYLAVVVVMPFLNKYAEIYVIRPMTAQW